MSLFEAGFARLVTFMGAIFALIIAWLAVSVTADVILRNFAIGNIPWLNEVAEYLLYTGTFIAAPWALRAGAHVRVDILVSALPRETGLQLERLLDVLGFVIAAILFYYGSVAVYDAVVSGAKQYKMLTISEWLLLIPFALSSLLLAIEFVFRFLRARAIAAEADSVLDKSGY